MFWPALKPGLSVGTQSHSTVLFAFFEVKGAPIQSGPVGRASSVGAGDLALDPTLPGLTGLPQTLLQVLASLPTPMQEPCGYQEKRAIRKGFQRCWHSYSWEFMERGS